MHKPFTPSGVPRKDVDTSWEVCGAVGPLRTRAIRVLVTPHNRCMVRALHDFEPTTAE